MIYFGIVVAMKLGAPIMYEHTPALRLYAIQAKDQELQQYATEIKLRAERRIGEISKGLEKAPGARTQLTSSHAWEEVPTKAEALKQAGLSTSTANRYEKIADIPEAEFESVCAGEKKLNEVVRVLRRERLATAARPATVEVFGHLLRMHAPGVELRRALTIDEQRRLAFALLEASAIARVAEAVEAVEAVEGLRDAA